MKIFAERLKELRLDKKISQEMLAKEIGSSRSAVSFWESAKKVPGFDVVIKISEFFGVSLEYLAGKED